MEINEFPIIKEASYLPTENVTRYRVILHFFLQRTRMDERSAIRMTYSALCANEATKRLAVMRETISFSKLNAG